MRVGDTLAMLRPGTLERCSAAAMGIAMQLWPQVALAQCPNNNSPPVLSEARAARWLIGDDVHAQAQLDHQRAVVASHLADHAVLPPTFEVFSHASFGFQGVLGGFPVCSDRGQVSASMERLRLSATVGLTHTPTQLQFRVSFVGARDQLSVGNLGKDGEDSAEAGYQQGLVAFRLGHARWGRALFGVVTQESPFFSPADSLSLSPRLAGNGTGSRFYGFSVPALRTHFVTLAQSSGIEVVQLLSSDLPLGPLPFSLSLGPTYIREERQVVGLVRLRGRSGGNRQGPRTQTWMSEDDGETHGTGSAHSAFGPVVEASTEAGEARLRHARLRFEGFTEFIRVVHDRSHHKFLRLAGYVEGSVFRSRFFERAIAASSATTPAAQAAAAWGGGLGATLELDTMPVAVVLDTGIGWNRPELLSLMPSSVDQFEVRGGVTFRVEN
jgi:hypothetical protein